MERLDCDRMFVAVMELGSFAKAAERLGTSAGQASKLISRLETELGVRLLNRTTRALSPTEVGQAYFERIRLLLEELDALDQSVKSRSGAASGRLHLTVPVSFGSAQLTKVLIDFARAYPDILLDVSYSDRTVNLVDEGFDAAVRVGNPADSSLIARRLCTTRIVLAATPAYLAQRGEPQVPPDLTRHDCIIDTNIRDPLVWRFRGGAEDVAVQVKGRLHFSNADACLAAAGNDLGIARVPSFMVGSLFMSGAMKPLLPAFELPPMGIHAIYPPGRHLAVKVRVLVDFLAARFQAGPDWEKGW